MSKSYDDVLESGYEAIAAYSAHPKLQDQIRSIMMMLYVTALLCSLRLGDDPPKNPMADPRWFSVPDAGPGLGQHNPVN
jgi:hypothetical protein